jgi:hypothetical protein
MGMVKNSYRKKYKKDGICRPFFVQCRTELIAVIAAEHISVHTLWLD